MIFAWRGVVWLVGSLSIAVLLSGALDVHLLSPVRSAIGAYDQAVAAVVAPLTPAVAMFLAPLHATFGAGPHLLPHWPHVFVVVLLQMLPRADETYGIGGITAAVLWCGQALLALLLALPIAAYVGAEAFIRPASEEAVFVGAFLVCAIAATAIGSASLANGPDESSEAALREADELWQERVNAINWWLLLLVLALVLVAGAGAVLGFWAMSGTVVMFLGIGFLSLLIWGGITVYSFLSTPRDAFDEWLAAEPLLVIFSFMAMAGAAVVLASHVAAGASDFAARYLFLFAAAPGIAVYYLGRRWLSGLAGRAEQVVRNTPTPALGMFIAGGVALLFANDLARW